jgi:hypothetical protein
LHTGSRGSVDLSQMGRRFPYGNEMFLDRFGQSQNLKMGVPAVPEELEIAFVLIDLDPMKLTPPVTIDMEVLGILRKRPLGLVQ